MPVIEISGEMNEYDVIECSDSEAEVLEVALATGLPVVLKITTLGVASVATYMQEGFIFQIESETILCAKIEDTGKWIVMFTQGG